MLRCVALRVVGYSKAYWVLFCVVCFVVYCTVPTLSTSVLCCGISYCMIHNYIRTILICTILVELYTTLLYSTSVLVLRMTVVF